jgi:hypothetical protein
VIGDPAKIQSLAHKEGFLKLGEVWKIFWIDGTVKIFNSFRREEDDGLVKSYSANLNHTYLLPSGDDIGYKDASVRYTDYAHFSICDVTSRKHPTYGYVVSFLKGTPIPQMQPKHFRIRRFGTLVRVFAEGVDPYENPNACFMPQDRVVYLKDRKLIMPALKIEMDGGASQNVTLGSPQWNETTGVCFYEGKVIDVRLPARVVYRVGAEGYAEALVAIPVNPGEVSYAVNVVLRSLSE